MIEVGSAAWLLKGTGDTVAASFYDDGALVDPGTVTVDIAFASGRTGITGRAATGTGAAARTVTLTPTELADLDILTLTWHTTIDAVAMAFDTAAEIVGASLFTIAEARAFDKAQLANPTKYPASAIAAARARIGASFAAYCGVEFVPRYRREVVDGASNYRPYAAYDQPFTWDNSASIELPGGPVRAVRSVETRAQGGAVWVAYDADELADVLVTGGGYLVRETGGYWPYGQRNVRVGYEAGYERPPEDIKRAALILLIDQLVTKDISERALSQTTEFGTFRIATAGERNSYFGLPLVDSVLHLYARQRVPVVR